MAYAQKANYLKQNLVITKNNNLVVLHNHYLNRVTNVANRFPNQARKNSRYYAINFTLNKIKSLKFTKSFNIKNSKKVQTYPKRFPISKSNFQVHTFKKKIKFVQKLNHSTKKNISIYPKIKAP